MPPTKSRLIAVGCGMLALGMIAVASVAEPVKLDAASGEQAAAEKKVLAEGTQRSLVPALVEFKKTAEKIEYPSGNLMLPGLVYRPAGKGPFPAMLWNHGSEKMPSAQVELARFYTEHGFVFFLPTREGHGNAPGDYIGDLQRKIMEQEKDKAVAQRKIVDLHDRFNADVVAAVAWLKKQPYVDADRIVMSGCSYGGIQTLLSAEKGLGVARSCRLHRARCRSRTRRCKSAWSRPHGMPRGRSFYYRPETISASAPANYWDQF